MTTPENWSRYAIGHHSLAVPPSFAPRGARASIDFNEIKVVRGYSGSEESYLDQMRQNGGVVFRTRVNGWQFASVREKRSNGRLSTTSLVLIGVQKIGSDIVETTRSASVSKVGNGSAPRLQRFHAGARVVPYSASAARGNFTLDGYVFKGYPSGLRENASTGITKATGELFSIDLSYGPQDEFISLSKRSGAGLVSGLGLSADFGDVTVDGAKGEYVMLSDPSSGGFGYNLAVRGRENDVAYPEIWLTYSEENISKSAAKEKFFAFIEGIYNV